MALQPWRTGKVIRIENETAETRRFWIAVSDDTILDYKPGQFVTLDLPIHEKQNKRWRSYSIASWPDGSNVFELVIVLDKHGAGTQYIFHDVQVGSELKFRGPQGVFTLREPIETDIYFICTGTGIAPFRSMIHHIQNNNIPHKHIYLIFGTRFRNTILYYEEMKKLSEDVSNFHYIPVLSREQWDGRTGYVHQVYEDLCANKPPAVFYLCGWKGMIDEATQRIMDLGYDKNHVHIEIYG